MITNQEQQAVVEKLQQIVRDAAAALSTYGVPMPDVVTREGQLQSELSAATIMISNVSLILGYYGPARGLPEHCAAVIAKLPKE